MQTSFCWTAEAVVNKDFKNFCENAEDGHANEPLHRWGSAHHAIP